MSPTHHLAVSMVCAGGVFAVTRSFLLSLLNLFAGVFIDLDHFIDYWRQTGFNFKVRRMLLTRMHLAFDRLFIFLHSFEVAFILLFLGVFLAVAMEHPLWQTIAGQTASGWLLSVAFGFLQHLALDQFFNPAKPLTYFLLYRLWHGFRTQEVFQRELDPKN